MADAVAAGPDIPYAWVTSQIDPAATRTCSLTSPLTRRGNLTAFGHRLGDAADPRGAAAALARIFVIAGPEDR